MIRQVVKLIHSCMQSCRRCPSLPLPLLSLPLTRRCSPFSPPLGHCNSAISSTVAFCRQPLSLQRSTLLWRRNSRPLKACHSSPPVKIPDPQEHRAL